MPSFPCVARGWLDPQALERAFPQQPPVPDAVQGHPSGETEVVEARLAVEGAGHAQHDLLAHHLHRPREVHLALGELALRHTRWPAEQSVERAVGHREAGEIIEVGLVQREGPVLAQVHQLRENRVDILGLTVRRQPHDLVFA